MAVLFTIVFECRNFVNFTLYMGEHLLHRVKCVFTLALLFLSFIGYNKTTSFFPAVMQMKSTIGLCGHKMDYEEFILF